MSRKTVRAVSVAAVLAMVLASMSAGVAVAAGSLRPALGPPNGKRVHAGRITLKVKDTDAVVLHERVYVAIARTRRTDKHGLLKSTCDVAKGCDFVGLKRWRHHPGWWIYTSGFNFAGYWATTPGKYFWQAQNVDCFHFRGCYATSNIGSFRVVG
ncbi:MAG: hypothetical protein JOZ98_15220 [Solirubrobacterales bacterium]|nr:hypothetical protein [Solirubrobacterales bacterium]